VSISVARRKRSALFLSITGLMFIVAAISAISARDPDGLSIRTGMVLVTVGAAMWLPWQALIPATIAVWLGPNFARNAVDGYELFGINMMLELPGFLGLAAMSTIARLSLRDLERQNVLLGMTQDTVGVDPITGVYEETQLRRSLEMELSRSRRFGRTFSLVLVGIDEMRQRFDYRDETAWQTSFGTTAELLRGTRNNVDRVYRYGTAAFALILPESEPKDVNGLVRRLRREARKAKPSEGEPGGPLPVHFGATFFPTCATTVNDLIRRAEIALRIADGNPARVQMDGAEAPEMPPAESMRQLRLENDEPDIQIKPAAEIDVATAPSLYLVGSESAEEPAETVAAEAMETAAAPVSESETISTPATAEEQPVAEPEATEPAPSPIYAIEVDEEPPLEAYVQAEHELPSIVYSNKFWQSEAPLSVLPSPRLAPQLVALNSHGEAKRSGPVDDSINDALKQLDDTLALIRSLKKRSA
jgi:diguanylate cyclase (GGDEF)-like protein